jgi:hypothetical protein
VCWDRKTAENFVVPVHCKFGNLWSSASLSRSENFKFPNKVTRILFWSQNPFGNCFIGYVLSAVQWKVLQSNSSWLYCFYRYVLEILSACISRASKIWHWKSRILFRCCATIKWNRWTNKLMGFAIISNVFHARRKFQITKQLKLVRRWAKIWKHKSKVTQLTLFWGGI